MMKILTVPILLIVFTAAAFAGDDLKLNPHLDYSSDSQDGPLITGERAGDGPVRGKPNYVFMFGEG